MKIPAGLLHEIKAHALSEYPKECCGLIVNGAYVKCENVATDPTSNFKIRKEVYLEHEVTGQLQAVIHSHCYGGRQEKNDPRWPSTLDMKSWLATSIPWGIVATNGTDETSEILWMDDSEIAPLVGRNFIHGIHDCYAVCRDYFRLELGITLKNYPRAMNWWNEGQDIYAENFHEAGFIEIPREEATVNDCCLFKVTSPVINHAAVITGPNQILHHLFHRLSGHDRLDRWEKHIVKYVRYQK